MKNLMVTSALLLVSGFSMANVIAPAPLVSIQTQDAFFDQLKNLCGQAFVGKVVSTDAADRGFASKRLVIHVRNCSEDQLQIPFHVGKDASRTWILTKTGSGLSLKHDHRKSDGSHDKSTMYGGHTIDAGWAQAQSFPADQYSKELFINSGIAQSVGNTWHMYIYPEKFTYRLTRQGREFKVDFDLTKPVTPPPAPWGYQD